MLRKTFKGLTDEILAWQTRRLLELERARNPWTAYVQPELVVEVAFDGVQRSRRSRVAPPPDPLAAVAVAQFLVHLIDQASRLLGQGAYLVEPLSSEAADLEGDVQDAFEPRDLAAGVIEEDAEHAGLLPPQPFGNTRRDRDRRLDRLFAQDGLLHKLWLTETRWTRSARSMALRQAGRSSKRASSMVSSTTG
jgi:hypothetical protein